MQSAILSGTQFARHSTEALRSIGSDLVDMIRSALSVDSLVFVSYDESGSGEISRQVDSWGLRGGDPVHSSNDTRFAQHRNPMRLSSAHLGEPATFLVVKLEAI
jgi:hypothetical protein